MRSGAVDAFMGLAGARGARMLSLHARLRQHAREQPSTRRARPPMRAHCLTRASPCARAGICNANTLDVTDLEEAIAVTVGRPKNALKPVSSKKTQVMKKGARKALKSVGKVAASFRPDLKVRLHGAQPPRAQQEQQEQASQKEDTLQLGGACGRG